jgi:signal transduction histidine kinase
MPAIEQELRDARTREERNTFETRLRQAEKMEAVGRLAGRVAHDFNNLLTVITGFSDLALAGLDTKHPIRGSLEQIKTAGQRAADLTQQLLAFSRQQVLKPTVLNLSTVVADFESLLRRTIPENIEIQMGLDQKLGHVKADPGQIEQVLLNLAVNARDAMPEGGKLTIETRNAELNEEYANAHDPVVPGDCVMLAVTDTGTGIETEILSRIFEPFFTTKEPGEGTGLGLATTYGIVKQSDGYI